MEASHQTASLIADYFKDDKVSFEDLRPLFKICRQLWIHPNQRVREQSVPLLNCCAAWLSREPIDNGTIASRMEHIAATILTIVHEADHSSVVRSFVNLNSRDLLHLVKSMDTCISAHNIDVDAMLSPKGIDITWEEGKYILAQLMGLSSDQLTPSSPKLR
jgi:hypothetical protein